MWVLISKLNILRLTWIFGNGFIDRLLSYGIYPEVLFEKTAFRCNESCLANANVSQSLLMTEVLTQSRALVVKITRQGIMHQSSLLIIE
jgi:hypothetical protein